MRRKSSLFAAFALSLALAASALAGCGAKREQEQEAEIPATRVGTEISERGTLELTSTYIGTVAPHNSVEVTPLVSGTVKQVNVKVGDKVKEGDLLCQFDDKAADLQLQSAKNAVESAKAGKEAAEDQVEAAKKQAEASITSMEGQVKTLEKQRDAQEEQLSQVKESISRLRESSEAAAEAYEDMKKIYDGANSLYIQYQSFLSRYSDCRTTAGLTAASIPKVKAPQVKIPPLENSVLSAQAAAEEDDGDDDDEDEDEDDDDEDDDDGGDEEDDEKQKTAAALVEDLAEIPLTVEYLTEAGLSTLREQMEQTRASSTSASSGYTQAQASVAQLEAAISQLDAQIEALEDNIDAAEDAADAAGSTKAYDAQIKAAQTGVESAQFQKDLYRVTSPIDGIVESVNVAENEIAAQGYPAFTISDKEDMEVSFYVSEEIRDFLKAGDEVLVESAGGDVKGSVSSIATAVDSQKGLFEIKARITQVRERELLSNTSVSLSLVTNRVRNQILIPFDAVYYDDDQAYVFIAQEGRAVRRDVSAGLYNNDRIAILTGLSEGDEVITTWGAGLKDGAPIEVIREQG